MNPGAAGGNASISIDPATAALKTGSSPVTFQAVITGSNETVSWSLGPKLGTLSSSTGPQVSYMTATVPIAAGQVVMPLAAGHVVFGMSFVF